MVSSNTPLGHTQNRTKIEGRMKWNEVENCENENGQMQTEKSHRGSRRCRRQVFIVFYSRLYFDWLSASVSTSNVVCVAVDSRNISPSKKTNFCALAHAFKTIKISCVCRKSSLFFHFLRFSMFTEKSQLTQMPHHSHTLTATHF